MPLRVFFVLVALACLSVWATAQEETPPPEASTIAATETLPPATPVVDPTLEPALTPEPSLAPPEIITSTLEPSLEPELEITPTLEAPPEVTSQPELEPAETPTPLVLPDLPTSPTLLPERIIGKGDKPLRVEAELLELAQNLQARDLSAAQQTARQANIQVAPDGQRVRIEVVARDEAEAARLRPLLEDMGGLYHNGYGRYLEYDFPALRLAELEFLSGDYSVRRPYEAQTLQTGTNVTEGLYAMGVDAYHRRGVRGQGVRIGIIDMGFAGLPSAETACVRGYQNFATPGLWSFASWDDHGTNVAEIVCDVAPAAEVYAAHVGTLSSLGHAVDWMLSLDVHIVTMSLSWNNFGVGDGTGEANSIVKRATDAGVLWFNSAGNYNGHTWNGAWSPTTMHLVDEGLITVQDFDGSPVNQISTLNCSWRGSSISYNVLLRWSDWNESRTGNASGVDLDFYLVVSTDGGSSWRRVDSSFKNQEDNPSVQPNEILQGSLTASDLTCGPSYYGTAQVGLVVHRWSSHAPGYLQIISSSGFLSNAAPYASIATPADSAAVFAVAASEVKSHSGWGWSPERYPDVAPYSSRGPTLGPGGTSPVGGLSKPDISAPTNTRTSRFNDFNGTSAASPHAAGLAALEFGNYLGFYTSLSGAQRIANFRYYFGRHRRPPRTSAYAECNDNPGLCFGTGVATLSVDWAYWSDVGREETDHSIVLSGISETPTHNYRWLSVPFTSASGGRYAIAYGRYPQAEFEVQGADGVRIFYYRQMDIPNAFSGFMRARILRNGVEIGSETTPLGGMVERVAWNLDLATIDSGFSYSNIYRVQLQPDAGSFGLSLDRVELIHPTTLQENHPALVYSGAWTEVVLPASSGGRYRQTSVRNAAVRFTTEQNRFMLYYTTRPDGGVFEVRVNGQVCNTCTWQGSSLSQYSGSTMTQAQAMSYIFIDPSIYGPSPYVVELVNTGRRSPNSSGTVITLDAVRIPNDARDHLAAPPLPRRLSSATTAPWQEAPMALPLDGVWTRVANPQAVGGFQWSTSSVGAQFVFRTDSRNLTVVHQNGPTGGQMEVWVNGTLCATCGTIDTYAPIVSTRNATSLTIPSSYPTPLVVSLRNSSQRNARSTGNFMVLERIEALNGTFSAVPYLDAAVSNPAATSSVMDLGTSWVQQADLNALYGDIAINSQHYDVAYFNTTSRRFDLILGRGPLGGRLRVSIWNGSAYDALATYDANISGAFLARQTLPISIPLTYTGPTFDLLLEVLGNEQIGPSFNFVYLDGLLILDNGTVTPSSHASSEILLDNSLKRQEIGPGWSDVPSNLGTLSSDFGRFERRTASAGASLQFYANSGNSPVLVFSRQPDGGIAEMWVNGVLAGELSFYAPNTLRRQWTNIPMPSGTIYPALVEIRNTNRRTQGSIGNFMYVDAVVSQSGALANLPSGTEDTSPSLTSSTIQRIGTGWTRQTNVATRMIDASDGEAQTTTATDAAIRFNTTTRAFLYVRSLATNGGLAEIWVDGQLCTACGTISQYAPFAVFRAARRVDIPTTIAPGSGPYTVEIRNTNRRPPGSAGNMLSIDAIIPIGGTISPTTLIHETSGDSTISSIYWLSTWTTTNSPAGLNGAFASHGNSFRATTTTDASMMFTANARNILIYRHMGPTGGTAQVYINSQFCAECATVNSYAPYLRYQVPYRLTIPDSYSLPAIVEISNTSTRFTGSTGNSLQIDASGLSPSTPRRGEGQSLTLFLSHRT